MNFRKYGLFAVCAALLVAVVSLGVMNVNTQARTNVSDVTGLPTAIPFQLASAPTAAVRFASFETGVTIPTDSTRTDGEQLSAATVPTSTPAPAVVVEAEPVAPVASPSPQTVAQADTAPPVPEPVMEKTSGLGSKMAKAKAAIRAAGASLKSTCSSCRAGGNCSNCQQAAAGEPSGCSSCQSCQGGSSCKTCQSCGNGKTQCTNCGTRHRIVQINNNSGGNSGCSSCRHRGFGGGGFLRRLFGWAEPAMSRLWKETSGLLRTAPYQNYASSMISKIAFWEHSFVQGTEVAAIAKQDNTKA